MARTKLGQALVRESIASDEKIIALERTISPDQPWRLGERLLEEKLCSEEVLKNIISTITGAPSVVLSQLRIPGYVAKLLSRESAADLLAIPVTIKTDRGEEFLYVAFFDPSSEQSLKRLEEEVRRPVKPIIAGYKEILNAIDRHLKPSRGGQSRPVAAPSQTMTQSSPSPFAPRRETDQRRQTGPIPRVIPPVSREAIPLGDSRPDLSVHQSRAASPSQRSARPARDEERRSTYQPNHDEDLDFSDVVADEDTSWGRVNSSKQKSSISSNDLNLDIETLENALSRRSEESDQTSFVDMDNDGLRDPLDDTGQTLDDASQIYIPSATRMLDLPLGGSGGESPAAGRGRGGDETIIDPSPSSQLSGSRRSAEGGYISDDFGSHLAQPTVSDMTLNTGSRHSTGHDEYGLGNDDSIVMPKEKPPSRRGEDDDLSLDIDALYANLSGEKKRQDTMSRMGILDEALSESSPNLPVRPIKPKPAASPADELDQLEALAQENRVAQDSGQHDSEDVTFIYDFLSGELPQIDDPIVEKLARIQNALVRILIDNRVIDELDIVKEYFKKN